MSLKHGDLSGTILPDISIDEFEPKAGNDIDVIVVAFYLTDKPPAADLNTFIQRSFIDTMDVEASASTDEEGRYLVFVEMSRDDAFPNKFQALIRDVSNVAGKMDWKITTYFSNGRSFAFNDPELYKYIIIDPADYVPKDEFNMKDIQESVHNFFNASMLTKLTFEGNIVTLAGSGKKMIAEVIDVGDYDTVIGRNFLSESAFNLSNQSLESRTLSAMLGTYNVLPLGEYLCVNYDEQVMLLKDTQLKYGS